MKSLLKTPTILLVLLPIFSLVTGCNDEPPLPPPNLEKRNEILAEVEKQFVVLKMATVEQAIRFLSHSDHRVRAQAARRLSEMKTQARPAAPHLIKRLTDDNRNVRIEAAYALGLIGDESALEPLMTKLMDSDRKVRLWAWKSLKKFGDRAIPKMVKGLSENASIATLNYVDEAGQVHSARAELRKRLASLGNKAVPFLVEGLNFDDIRIRSNSISTLGEMGPAAKDAIEPLINVLETVEDSSLRRYAIISLRNIGDLSPTVAPAIQRATRDPDKRVAKEAEVTLTHFRKVAESKKKK